MKLTNQQVYDYILLKLDKPETAYFPEEWVTKVFNESYAEWIANTAKEGELTEKRRFDLHALVVRQNPAPGKTVVISNLSPKLYRTWAVFADYNFTCKGKTTVRTRRVKPVSWDSYAVAGDDPSNRSTEQFPLYAQLSTSDGLVYEILTKTPPVKVTVVYIKEPTWIDIENNPSGSIEVEYPQQLEIIDICVLKLLQTVEDQFRSTMQAQVEIPNNE